MNDRTTRRDCERRLRELRVPPGAPSVEAIVEHVARQRGRPVELLPMSLGGSGVSGAWIPGAERDHVFFEASTSRRHQVQIIAHELGHMICGHRPALHASIAQVASVLPVAARHMLARDAYDDLQEREAEHMADLLVGHLDTSTAPRPVDPVSAALQHRPLG
jgi:hypothetical protein